MTKTVIVHDEMGVFIGAAAGMAFWSMLDAGGQWTCVTFDDEADARDFVESWTPAQNPDGYRYVSVDTTAAYATIGDLDRADLSDFTALLLYNTPVSGIA